MSLTILPGLAVPKSKYFFSGLRFEKFFPFLEQDLEMANMKFKDKEYMSMSIFSSIVYFVLISMFMSAFFYKLDVQPALVIGSFFGLFISLYILFQSTVYPKRIISLKIRSIEENIMPMLEDMLVQLSASVPIYEIMVNISKGDYAEISKEFGFAINSINSGENEIDVLDELARKNPSKFFRRAIWQIVNSMKSGTKIEEAIKDTIDSLSEMQTTQIQKYGSSLSGIVVFYMLIAVVVPTLFITFFIVLSLFFAMTPFVSIIILALLYLFVLFFEIMFLGIMRIKRPKLI